MPTDSTLLVVVLNDSGPIACKIAELDARGSTTALAKRNLAGKPAIHLNVATVVQRKIDQCAGRLVLQPVL